MPNNKTSVLITGIITLSLLVGVAPLLGFSIPRSVALSPQSLYPDLNSSSGCGYGLGTSSPKLRLPTFRNIHFFDDILRNCESNTDFDECLFCDEVRSFHQ